MKDKWERLVGSGGRKQSKTEKKGEKVQETGTGKKRDEELGWLKRKVERGAGGEGMHGH